MSRAQLFSEVAVFVAGLIFKYRATKERIGSVADMSARELREYGLRCCPPGSVQDRRATELRFWPFEGMI